MHLLPGMYLLSQNSPSMPVCMCVCSLYSRFDELLEGHDVYKIETIGVSSTRREQVSQPVQAGWDRVAVVCADAQPARVCTAAFSDTHSLASSILMVPAMAYTAFTAVLTHKARPGPQAQAPPCRGPPPCRTHTWSVPACLAP
jgi:hypothetical protein